MTERCIYTGVVFLDEASGDVRVGDLFAVDGEFEIRGIPSGHLEDDGTNHISVKSVEYRPRKSGEFTDSQSGIEITWTSYDFGHHIIKWHPELYETIVPGICQAVY